MFSSHVGRGQRSSELYTFVHFHFCSCASNMSNRYLWMKSYNSKVKPVGVGNVYLIIDCVQLFLENTLRKQSFWIWKDEWKWKLCFDIWKGNKCFGGDFKLHFLVQHILNNLFEMWKACRCLGETPSYTFLSNIS